MSKPCGVAPKLIAFNGEVKSIRDWADTIGLHSQALRYRLAHWTVEQALTIGKNTHNPRKRGRAYGFKPVVGGGGSNTSANS